MNVWDSNACRLGTRIRCGKKMGIDDKACASVYCFWPLVKIQVLPLLSHPHDHSLRASAAYIILRRGHDVSRLNLKGLVLAEVPDINSPICVRKSRSLPGMFGMRGYHCWCDGKPPPHLLQWTGGRDPHGFQWMTKAVDDVLVGLKGDGRQVRHPRRVIWASRWNNNIMPRPAPHHHHHHQLQQQHPHQQHPHPPPHNLQSNHSRQQKIFENSHWIRARRSWKLLSTPCWWCGNPWFTWTRPNRNYRGRVCFLKPTQILETDEKRNLRVGKMLLWKEMLEKCIVSEAANWRYGWRLFKSSEEFQWVYVELKLLAHSMNIHQLRGKKPGIRTCNRYTHPQTHLVVLNWITSSWS